MTASGVKSYVFEGRLFGKTIRITIGSPNAWPLERHATTDAATGKTIERLGARQEAARLKALMDRGIDPREERAEQRAEHEARKLDALRQNEPHRILWRLGFLRESSHEQEGNQVFPGSPGARSASGT
ncbi:Arm DNA-binding domain-containing protein [Burkholderia vietnamiensis]|uniref:Arm DNA-binding domain-containing protein n=1 Tax=Burkholderia vietnamiensis TaxID=60552 RepID=UPI003BEEFD80